MGREILLRAEGLYKTYSVRNEIQTEVLKGISIEVSRGEFVAVTGPSGAGKSTLLHLLGSLDSPDKGTIKLMIDGNGYDYSRMPAGELSNIRNSHIGFVFQFHHLLPEFTALENVMIPAFIAGKSWSEAKPKALELLKSVGIEQRAEHKPAELSGGEQQRVAIARALINAPTIVFADEPTGNLDQENSKSMLELIMRLRREHGLTFVVATHSAEVAAIAERIISMKDGKLI